MPIGLFGDFYFHELSFCLINNNDYNNLNNIFSKCNLKIKKILLKSFVEGSYTSNENYSLDTFSQIKINENNSQIFYFENDALKFEQNFNFGSDLIVNDIVKITSLKIDIVKKILNNIKLNKEFSKDEFIEKSFFQNENYIKIKKKLIFEIAEARIQELLEILIFRNINLLTYDKKDKIVFLSINNKAHFKCFEDAYRSLFLKQNNLIVKFIENTSIENLISNVNQLVHFGWKKEAIPVTHTKKSMIAKFFDALFS